MFRALTPGQSWPFLIRSDRGLVLDTVDTAVCTQPLYLLISQWVQCIKGPTYYSLPFLHQKRDAECFLERVAEHECLSIRQLGGSGGMFPGKMFLKIESLQWLEMHWKFCIRVCNGMKNSPPPFYKEDKNLPPPPKKKMHIPKFYLPPPPKPPPLPGT